jgi:HSP20 family protein
MTDKRPGTTREERSIERSSDRSSGFSSRPASPFRMLERFTDEVDRVFDDFGFGRWRSRRPWRGFGMLSGEEMWTPDVEIFHRNSELVIHADLPGLTKDDVKVDVTENQVSIEGERQRQHEEEREGVYRSERSYGRFYRVIPLPEGVIADQAKATFKDGVLEITMPAPPEQARRGRRLEISEGASTPGSSGSSGRR